MNLSEILHTVAITAERYGLPLLIALEHNIDVVDEDGRKYGTVGTVEFNEDKLRIVLDTQSNFTVPSGQETPDSGTGE